VQEANGARSAFDTLKQRRFGIVVCDIEMRDVSGLQLVQAVRSDPELRSTPILLITGSMKPDYIGQGRHLGADGFLLKPFTVQALRRKMVEVVSLAQSEATNAFRLAHAYRAGGSRFN
jgi:two-component system chemotaxis response regulator CheY